MKTKKATPQKAVNHDPFSGCGVVSMGSSKAVFLSQLRAISKETKHSIGVNELAQIMTENEIVTDKDSVRKGFQKIRKNDFIGYEAGMKEGHLISKDGKEMLHFRNSGDKVKGVFYYLETLTK